MDDLFTPAFDDDENSKSSDKTIEYDVEEMTKKSPQKVLSPVIEVDSFKPDLSSLLCAMKSEGFLLTQDRIPLQEKSENTLQRSFSCPSSSEFRNINSSPVQFQLASPQTPIVRRRKVVRRKRNNHQGFLATQAAVDDNVASTDEDEENLDNSIYTDFISNETICSQNQTHMFAKYVESIKSPIRGNFVMPRAIPLVNFSQVFSQAVEIDDGSYSDEDDDSFVVKNSELITEDSEPDELEIAERKLKEKNKKQKRSQLSGKAKRRKIIHDTSDEDEELKKMRAELDLIPE